jgi:hypothetical protein
MVHLPALHLLSRDSRTDDSIMVLNMFSGQHALHHDSLLDMVGLEVDGKCHTWAMMVPCWGRGVWRRER